MLTGFATAFAQPMEGLLYVWIPAGEHSAKLSTTPPPWYRIYEPSRGPRVRVYRGRSLIDDTGLSIAERYALVPRPKLPPKPS